MGKDLWARTALYFGGSKLDSFPMWGRIAFHFKEGSVTPSLCGEGFVGRDSFACEGEAFFPHVGKDLLGGIAVHLRGRESLLLPHSFVFQGKKA